MKFDENSMIPSLDNPTYFLKVLWEKVQKFLATRLVGGQSGFWGVKAFETWPGSMRPRDMYLWPSSGLFSQTTLRPELASFPTPHHYTWKHDAWETCAKPSSETCPSLVTVSVQILLFCLSHLEPWCQMKIPLFLQVHETWGDGVSTIDYMKAFCIRALISLLKK